MGNTWRTRPPHGASTSCEVLRSADAVGAHLEDAAHFPGGHAAGIATPRSEADVASLVRAHRRVLAVGAQSSLTGGATPFGDLLVDTTRLADIHTVRRDRLTVQAGVTLDAVQAALRPLGAAYPPTPTFTGATAGGSVATNAAGAATFKYGSTREWVEGLTIVLASGEVLELARGECLADETGFVIATSRAMLRVPVGTYRMPHVPKRSAGYFAAPGMDLVDLFIGSEGTLGIVTDVTFKVLHPAPATALALIFCPSEPLGIALASELRAASLETWRRRDSRGIDACAIEHMDRRSLSLIRIHGDLRTLNIAMPEDTALALLVQLELPPAATAADTYDQVGAALLPDGPDTGLVRFCRLLDRAGVLDRTELAAPGDLVRQQQLLRFREAVPTRVNQVVGAARRDIDPRIEKTAADMIVPFERFAGMMDAYRRGFESRGLDFAVWGHISDGNVHPNVLPRSYDDVLRGREAILEFGRETARLGGSPLAEHGVGRSEVKQALLRQLYGEEAIAQMREAKRALDPEWKLAPGVIFPP